jgi:DNA-binding NtrC family response regulator
MPQVTGLDILRAAQGAGPETPVILMTAQASLQSAIQSVNEGAFYYIQKPFANDELLTILKRACEFRQIRVENKQLKQEIRRRGPGTSTVSRPIGKSKRFLDVFRLAEQVAPTGLDGADPGRERHRQGGAGALSPQPRCGRTGPSSPSTAARSPRPCSRASSSAT